MVAAGSAEGMMGVAWRVLQPRLLRALKLAVAAAGLAGPGLKLRAQESGPVLLLQPGMLTADFLSAPEGYPATTGFNLRFATRVPTSSRWWTLLVGASVTPYGTTGITPRSTNTPILFAGNVFPLLAASRTGGWLEAELPLLLTYSFGGGGAYNRDFYGRDFVAELAIHANVGPKVLRDLGPFFSRLRVYLLFDQNLTPNEDPNTGVTDRFNPTALYGITIPIGGRRATP